MAGFTQRFCRNKAGATAIEYALIASLIGIVIMTAVGALGTQLNALFNSVKDAFP
jgi:pilus assembly protein Flp/PilA